MTEPRFYLFKCCPLAYGGAPIYVIDRAYNHKVVDVFQGKKGLRPATLLANKLNAEEAE